MLNPPRASEGFTEDGGEIEIENLFFDEIEIRRKDLLPVFEQFRCIQSSWNDRYRLYPIHFFKLPIMFNSLSF